MNKLKSAILYAAGMSLFLSPIWGTGASGFLGLAFLFSLLFLFIEKPRIPHLTLLPFLGLFVWALLGMLWTDNQSEGWRQVQTLLSFLMIPVVILGIADVPDLRKKTFRVLSASLVFSLILMGIDVVQTMTDTSFIYAITGSQLSLPYLHRAYFMNHVAIVGLLFILNTKTVNWKAALIVVILSVVFWILQGRMNLMAFALVLILTAGWGLWKKQRSSAILALLSLGIFIGSYALDYIPSRFDQDVSNEFEAPDEGVPEKNSRWFMWEKSMEAYQESPYLGVGTGDTHDAINAQFEKVGYEFGLIRNYNSHNQYVQTLLTYGPVGLGLLLGLLLLSLQRGWNTADGVLVMWTIYIALVLLTESYFDRFHGVYLFTAVTSLLLITTKRV